MASDRELEARLERCKICKCPDEGLYRKCPGNGGLGCIGDWRCCLELKEVCTGCTDCGVRGCLYCENTECEKMRKFKNDEE